MLQMLKMNINVFFNIISVYQYQSYTFILYY